MSGWLTDWNLTAFLTQYSSERITQLIAVKMIKAYVIKCIWISIVLEKYVDDKNMALLCRLMQWRVSKLSHKQAPAAMRT